MPDFTIKQSDVQPIFADTLSYSNGEAANLEGATVAFQMRSLRAREALKLTGTTAIQTAKEGKVTFTPSAADTATPGDYVASWHVTLAGGETVTFPTAGYLWVQVEESILSVHKPRLAELEEVKDHLNIPSTVRQHDIKLMRLLDAVAPVIEAKTGPLLPQFYDEWYDGGNTWISLRHRPVYGFGTTPILNLVACSEYLGPIEWPLDIVQSPDLGQLYSCMVDARRGRIVRRTAGGGVQAFAYGPQAVHAVYEAGQEEVPANVRVAVLEALREFYDTTMATGSGRRTVADAEEPAQRSLGYLVARHALAMIEPVRRHPSLA